mmetsp:Transcript_35470/g.93580  ORF Transcript_35470/g.93580 Transcript_35470/m.93580 type:complete len:727 (-) Transcript_35470:136-2316(-)
MILATFAFATIAAAAAATGGGEDAQCSSAECLLTEESSSLFQRAPLHRASSLTRDDESSRRGKHKAETTPPYCASAAGTPPPAQVEIAVVGGGISGAYTAWRLQAANGSTSQGQPRVWMFERTSRVGGRFVSPAIGCKEGSEEHLPRAELGGMRIASNNSLMLGVCRELNISLGPFHMRSTWSQNDSTSVQDDDLNPVGIRDLLTSRTAATAELSPLLQHVRREMKPPVFVGTLPYVLPRQSVQSSQQNHDKGGQHVVFDETHYGVLPPWSPDASPSGAPPLTITDPCDGQANKRFMERKIPPLDVPIWQYSEGSLALFENASDEEFSFADAISGYATSRTNTNLGVAEAVKSRDGTQTIPERPETRYYVRPLLGMEEIPRRLAQEFSCRHGGGLLLNLELVRVVRRESSSWPFELTFASTRTSPCSEVTHLAQETHRVLAREVVLALPYAALERVEFLDERPGRALGIQSAVRGLLEAVHPWPSLKLFAAFSNRWWETAGAMEGGQHKFTTGRLTSSTVGVQAFAWCPGTQQAPDKMPSQCSSDMGVMQMYSVDVIDRIFPGFTLGQQLSECTVMDPNRCGECFNTSSGFFGEPRNHASRLLVEAYRRELSSAFSMSVEEVPEPYELKYHIWDAADPVTRSWAVHFWKAGFKWWELYDLALELEKGLHVVGETFSYTQAWGEGALETAEYMLHEKMGLQLPAWLSKQEYCWAMPYYANRRHSDAA